jgi:FkbM family methyltransferase
VANPTRIAAGIALRVLQRLVPSLAAGDRSALARTIVRDRFDPASRAMAAFFADGLAAWSNRQYDVEKSGESALLARLRPFRPAQLIDVGANVGEWMEAACRELPDATVHAFEIVGATYQHLVAAAAPFGNRVICNNFGLGETDAEVTMHFAPDSPTTASLLRDVIDIASEDQGFAGITEVVGRIRRGDDYLAEHRLQRVALLKIDVEGAEMRVLAGFEKAFAAEQIDLVQFEYGRPSLVTRVFLADFHRFFESRGFVLGKLFPEGVGFKPYELDDEDFRGPNYVACLRSRSDLIEALRCPPLRLAP